MPATRDITRIPTDTEITSTVIHTATIRRKTATLKRLLA
jgi:hypothetical protein